MTSEPELAWTEYLAQGDWAQQLEDLIGQPQEVWSGQERQMLMMDQTGQWYLITFSRWWDGDYMQVGASRQDEVSLEGCTRIF